MALVTEEPADLPITDALAGQQSLIPAAYVKVRVGGIILENPPQKDDSVTLIVKGTITEVTEKRMKDGENRHIIVVEAEQVYEKGKVPIVDEPQPGLFDAVDDDGSRDDPDALDDPELPGDDGDGEGDE